MGGVDGDELPERVTPVSILGCRVWTETHVRGGYQGLRTLCSTHDACKCFRSFNVDVESFGPDAAALFLEVWISKAAELDRAAHRKYKPTRADIRQYLQSRDQ
jgi:hypothetical protein